MKPNGLSLVMRRWTRCLTSQKGLAVLAGALIISIAANIALYCTAIGYYRQVQSVRLDPLELGRYQASNRTMPPPKPGCPRIVLIGDSRIAQWCPLPQISDSEVINRGISGQTTAQVLLRLDDDALSLKPDIVVIETGINDLKSIGVLPGQQGRIVDLCVDNLEQMAERVCREGAQAVILTIFPVGPIELSRRPVWSAAIPRAVAEANSRLADLTKPGVRVVDCDAVLKKGDELDKALSADALHLRREGYVVLNALVGPVLEDLAAKPRSRN